MSECIPARLIRRVRTRARGLCEYCRLPQSSQEAVFHIDHVRPGDAGGKTHLDNLALACVTCSLRKAARTHGRDPRSRQRVPLFNPRRNSWARHFRWTPGWQLVGLTTIGRVTIAALGMNRPAIVAIRRMLAMLGRFPDDNLEV
jgi:HNH endonuclease